MENSEEFIEAINADTEDEDNSQYLENKAEGLYNNQFDIMTRVEIEQKIQGQKEKIEVLEQELRNEREDLMSLQNDLEASLREELTDILSVNEAMEQELLQRA